MGGKGDGEERAGEGGGEGDGEGRGERGRREGRWGGKSQWGGSPGQQGRNEGLNIASEIEGEVQNRKKTKLSSFHGCKWWYFCYFQRRNKFWKKKSEFELTAVTIKEL